MDSGKIFPNIAIYPENGMREAHSQGFLVCVARIFTHYGREITHFYGQRCITLHISILSQCIALRIKNWQFDERCILHTMLQQ